MMPFPGTHQQPLHIDATMGAQQQEFSRLDQHLGRVSYGSTRIDDLCPLLPNYHLPVAIDDELKSSGPQNLSREGWDRNQCRNFLVRVLGWVPRNFQYEDGLRIIHPRLQERFGDENVDLACAVLEELVERESPPPFPEAVYQRWKHRHRNRHEDFLLPHAPHTTTILAHIVPTKPLLTLQKTSEPTRVATTTLSMPSQPASDYTSTSPTSPVFSTGRSASAHLGTAWQIEHSIFVSKGGEKASVLYCPTPEDFHRHLWDPEFGRGGKLVEERRLLIGNRGLRACQDGEDNVLIGKERVHQKHKTELVGQFRAEYSRRRPREKALRSCSTQYGNGSYNSQPSDFFPLPENVRIPHGIFARKHGIVPEGEPMPISIIKGESQPTMDEITLKKSEEALPRAIALAKKLQDSGDLDETDATEHQERSVDVFLSKISPTPGLFFDSGIEYQWGAHTPDSQRSDLKVCPPPRPMKETQAPDCPKQPPRLPTNSGSYLTPSQLSIEVLSQETNNKYIPNSPSSKSQNQSSGAPNPGVSEFFSLGLNKPSTSETGLGLVREQEVVLSNHHSSAVPEDYEYEEISAWKVKQRNINSVRSTDSERRNKHAGSCGHLQAQNSGNLRCLVPRMEYNERNVLSQRRAQRYNEVDDGLVLVREARALNRDKYPAINFDGALDDSHFSHDNDHKQMHGHNNYNTNKVHNKPRNENFWGVPMDPDQFTPLRAVSPTKPLHVRKQSSKVNIERSQQQLGDNNPYKDHSTTPIYPPRTSSIRKSDLLNVSELVNDSSAALNPARSTLSSYRGTYHSDTSADAPSTARTTIESHKADCTSSLTSGIMGDFIPIDQTTTDRSRATENGNSSPDTSSFYRQAVQAKNPYEFEPDSPYSNDDRQTTFTDFIRHNEVALSPSPRSFHVKNSRSEGNAIYLSQGTSPMSSPTRPSGPTIHRSDSSPSVLPLRFPTRRNRTPSPDIVSYYQEDDEPISPAGRGREIARDATHRGRHFVERNVSRSPVRLQLPGQAQKSEPRSPNRRPNQVHSKGTLSMSSGNDRHLTRSPTKTLDDVVERDEFDSPNPSLASPPNPTKKRSRSPMKKMFGEHGWLGQSPDEVQEHKLRSKKSSTILKEDSAQRQKKPSIMGKLKNKLEEIAEKADLSPSRFRSDQEKHPKLSVLSVSLGPPEQARIYMEVELMLVHTANNFLMHQFSQGRIAVDSIKKTVDIWKSKGRPLVIEFMYDQATQRDLVASNQHNFRFHGERAGDNIRINSMLYNWKQVANLMAIRTFCNADTVILKLLFDIEQILELLGAGEPIMLRLQQIRASANEMMRIARRDKDLKAAAPPIPNGREMVYNSNSSAGSNSRSQSMDDPYYDGLKMVTDFHVERGGSAESTPRVI